MRYKLLILSIFFFVVKGVAQTDFSKFFEGDEQERTYKVEYWCVKELSTDPNTALTSITALLKEAEKRNDKMLILFTRYVIAYYHIVYLREDDPWMNEALKVLEEAKSNHYDFLWAELMQRTGIIYTAVKREYAKGLEFQLRAHEKYTELGYSRTLRRGTVLYELALVYYDLGNYEKCLELLKPAIHFKETTDSYTNIQILNTVGLAYRNLHKSDSALKYFFKTLEAAKTKNDKAWVGIASINIGKNYIAKGEYAKALPYVETRYKYSKIKDPRLSESDSCEALVTLAQIDVHYGNLDRALERLKMVEKSLKPDSWWNNWKSNFDLWRDMYSLLSDIYFRKNDYKKAYTFSVLAHNYEDSIINVKTQSQSQKIHTQVEAEKQLARLKQIESETKLSIQSRNFSMIALALGGFLLLSLYNRQRLKTQKDRELFQNREQLLYSEKQRAEEQLSGYMDTLHEKNKMIEEFHTEIERLKSLPYSSEKLQTIETLEKLQQTTIITEDDWLQFKELFEKVHQGFFTRVKDKYPEITQAEMRLLALTKLNISTKDMANMLGISPDSIRKTGYRFLKKISPDGEADLSEIAASI